MKHIVKIMSLLVALSAVWISLLQTSVLPASYTWLLPLYFVLSLGCYGLSIVGVGLMHFPTFPHETILLRQDVIEAKEFLKAKGVGVGTNCFFFLDSISSEYFRREICYHDLFRYLLFGTKLSLMNSGKFWYNWYILDYLY